MQQPDLLDFFVAPLEQNAFECLSLETEILQGWIDEFRLKEEWQRVG